MMPNRADLYPRKSLQGPSRRRDVLARVDLDIEHASGIGLILLFELWFNISALLCRCGSSTVVPNRKESWVSRLSHVGKNHKPRPHFQEVDHAEIYATLKNLCSVMSVGEGWVSVTPAWLDRPCRTPDRAFSPLAITIFSAQLSTKPF